MNEAVDFINLSFDDEFSDESEDADSIETDEYDSEDEAQPTDSNLYVMYQGSRYPETWDREEWMSNKEDNSLQYQVQQGKLTEREADLIMHDINEFIVKKREEYKEDPEYRIRLGKSQVMNVIKGFARRSGKDVSIPKSFMSDTFE